MSFWKKSNNTEKEEKKYIKKYYNVHLDSDVIISKKAATPKHPPMNTSLGGGFGGIGYSNTVITNNTLNNRLVQKTELRLAKYPDGSILLQKRIKEIIMSEQEYSSYVIMEMNTWENVPLIEVDERGNAK